MLQDPGARLRVALFAESLGLHLKLLRDHPEIWDRPLNSSLADSFALAEVPEHRQGSGEFVAEQVTELLNVAKILR